MAPRRSGDNSPASLMEESQSTSPIIDNKPQERRRGRQQQHLEGQQQRLVREQPALERSPEARPSRLRDRGLLSLAHHETPSRQTTRKKTAAKKFLRSHLSISQAALHPGDTKGIRPQEVSFCPTFLLRPSSLRPACATLSPQSVQCLRSKCHADLVIDPVHLCTEWLVYVLFDAHVNTQPQSSRGNYISCFMFIRADPILCRLPVHRHRGIANSPCPPWRLAGEPTTFTSQR